MLTAWIVGHTNRFRAAVSMRPVIDWQSFVGMTDSAGWYRQFKKLPWEDPMEYAMRSPLTYVGNVTTPTMVMTGEADLRTPIGQSEEFYRALKMLGRRTRCWSGCPTSSTAGGGRRTSCCSSSTCWRGSTSIGPRPVSRPWWGWTDR